MRISDWSSDVCSSDLQPPVADEQIAARPVDRETRGMADVEVLDVAGAVGNSTEIKAPDHRIIVGRADLRGVQPRSDRLARFVETEIERAVVGHLQRNHAAHPRAARGDAHAVRADERRVGTEGDRTGGYRWW